MNSPVSTLKQWLFLSVASIALSQSPLLAAAPQVLNIGNGPDLRAMDPQKCTTVYEDRVMLALFDGLIDEHPQTGKVIPALAESWTVSKDGKEYIFKLRKDAKWSNGDAITADDWVYSWRRNVSPELASEYAYMSYYLKNGQAINTGKEKDPTKLGVQAVDKYTLKVTLENPTPYFLVLLNHYSYYPVHKASIEKHGANWTRPENMVVTGAFTLAKHELNRVVTVKKNPLYWDAKNVKLDEVNFYTTENMDTEEKMFRSGQLHITNEVPNDKIALWKADKTNSLYSHPWFGTYFYRLNTKKAHLSDKRVRKALALAIDRERITKYVTKGNEEVLLGFVPTGTLNHKKAATPLVANASKVAEAKKLMKEAGYGEGGKKLVIELTYNTEERHKRVAEAIQQMWKENLGVEAKLFNQEMKVMLSNEVAGNFELSRGGWIGDYNDPLAFLELMMSNNGNNRTGYANPKYDALMEATSKTQDQKKRTALFQQGEALMLEDMPIIPIYMFNRNYLLSPKVEGWYPQIQDRHKVKYVSINVKS